MAVVNGFGEVYLDDTVLSVVKFHTAKVTRNGADVLLRLQLPDKANAKGMVKKILAAHHNKQIRRKK